MKVSQFFAEIERFILKIHMEFQGTLNSLNDIEEEEQNCRTPTCWFQNLLQRHGNKTVRAVL